jgi:replicative DNA helicase
MKKSREAVGAGAKIIALDYLQLMEGQGNNRNAEVEKISRSWKNLLKELDVPGIALSQLSRNLESEGRRPRMSDLRDSGSIEQDADVIWMLHREKDNSGNEHTLLLQEKGRQIGRGYCDLMFAGSWQRFNEIERE